MDNKANTILKSATQSLFLCVIVAFIFCGQGVAQNNVSFGELSDIYKRYEGELNELYTQFKKTENKEKREIIKQKRNNKQKEYIAAIEAFNQTSPLKEVLLPFKAMGTLPFTINNVKITEVTAKSVKFNIQVKVNNDIKKADGKLSQRMNVYFWAFDTKGNKIVKTGNWATNHGWVELKAGTTYDAQGHWNANKIKSMRDFGTIRIMSQEDYKILKKK